MSAKFSPSQRTFHEGRQSISQLQLAPSLEHQIAAMFSILVRWLLASRAIQSVLRYNWNHIGVVTSEIVGHEKFVQSVREMVLQYHPRSARCPEAEI